MTNPAPELRLVQSGSSEPAPDPLIGSTLDGRYVVERTLGAGGMGLVYKARHVVLGKALAIKVLKQEVSRDEQVMARFRREAQSAGSVGSPHICDVSDFGTLPDGSTYFVMEFLDGPSLSKALEQQRPMAIERILDIGRQLCDALGAAHERGIVHRDLKPDNIHLVRQGKRQDFCKVLDFGIAKVAGAADKKLTQAGQIFGTPHYMSPEQCAGRDVDHRTDVYAIGVMLYEMATGQVPFDADNLMGVLTKHVYENPIPPREFPPPVNVPPGLEAVILKCLAKKPDQRYQSMFELKSDLELCAQGGTPIAVMQAMDPMSMSMMSASMHGGVPATMMMGSAPPITMTPSGPSSMHAAVVAAPPPPKRTGLVIGLALAGLLMLGVGAFAAAFFVFGNEQTPVVVTNDPPPETPDELRLDTPPEPNLNPQANLNLQPNPVPQPEVQPQPQAPARVHLVTDPAAAEVYAGDGTLIGNAPLDIERPASGQTTNLTIRAPGHQDRTFTVSHLTSNEVTVRLDRARSANRPRPQPQAQNHPQQPTPQPLHPQPQPQPRHNQSGIGSEIINPF